MNEKEEKRSQKITYISALLIGAIVFAFQSLLNRWLAIAVGATISNQIAILIATYIFFGLGAYSARAFKIKRKVSYGLLLVILLVFATTWPELPLYLSSVLKGLDVRFVFTVLIIAPVFLMFGMAVPQLNNQSNETSFAKIFFWFHLGAALFLVIYDFFFLVRLGLQFSFYFLAFLVGTLLLLSIKHKKTSIGNKPQVKLTWNQEILSYSILNGLIQGILLYINNRTQGPFSASFTCYLVTSMTSLSLASFLTEKYSIDKSWYKKIVSRLLPIALLWAIMFSFAVPYIYSWFSLQEGASVNILRLLVVWFQFSPTLLITSLLIPAYVRSDFEDFDAIALNSWGNVLGIITYLIVMTIFANIKLAIFLLCLFFLAISIKKREIKSLASALVLLILSLSLPQIFFTSSFRFFESPELFWSTFKNGRVLQSKNILGAQVDILSLPAGKTLVIDGYKSVLLKNTLPEKSHERLLGKFQKDLVENKGDALVLGVGSGATVASIAESFDNVYGVEIHPVIYRIRDFFSGEFLDLTKFSNLTKVFDDGHSFLSRTNLKFDLIVNNVPTPQYSPASSLWTMEFYKAVREHLRPNGVYSQWIDGAINRSAIIVILKTLQSTFKRCYFAVVTSTYGNIFCSNNDDLFLTLTAEPLVFPIRNWDKINHSRPLNSLNYPNLEYFLSPFLTKSWLDKEDWFLLDILKITKEDINENSCESLSEVKIFKGTKLPAFCRE